jgi:hypothetical protein
VPMARPPDIWRRSVDMCTRCNSFRRWTGVFTNLNGAESNVAGRKKACTRMLDRLDA